MEKNEVYLDTYALQKDMRIRMPKQILLNLPTYIGCMFNIYLNSENGDIILRIADGAQRAEENDENS